jgi:Fur family peroxide stress response transcriptional regulator
LKGGFFMATLKYSRQREAIKEYLMSTTEHPTADTVYLHVKEEFPNISLGTVYRNLNLLADIGEAIKITTPEGGDRFDGNTDPHYHVVCTACGKVDDLHLDQEQIEAVNKLGNSHYSGSIKTHTTLFYGNCSECCSK